MLDYSLFAENDLNMKIGVVLKSFLVVGLLFIAAHSFSRAAVPDCGLVVSGAGTAIVNGDYANSGTFNGAPTYSQGSIHISRFDYFSGIVFNWKFADEISNNSDQTKIYYLNDSTGIDLPKSGWNAFFVNKGTNPPPDIVSNPCPENNGSSPSVRRTWYYRPPSTNDTEVKKGNTSLWFKNGSAGANFSEGVCLQQCTVNNQLPNGAKNALPNKGVLATLYVRVVDEGGAPGNGSYSACFANPDGEDVVIYQFVSGSWLPVMYGSATTFCAPGNGDGAFYLGVG